MKKLISIMLVLILILSSFPAFNITAIAANDKFIDNPNWVEASMDEVDAKFNNNESFVVMFYRTSCFNSNLRKHIVTSWLVNHGITVYGVDTDEYSISNWAWAKLSGSSVSMPVICIVKNNQEYGVFPSQISMRVIQQNLHELLGIYDSSVVDFYQLNNDTYTNYNTTSETAKYLRNKSQINSLLVAKAEEITQGISGDYQKIKAIHDWVAENIFYDYVLLETGVGTTTDIGTYNQKRSVCEGYSNLMASLIQAVGIPCRVVHGFALGVGSDEKVVSVWNAYQDYIQDGDLTSFKRKVSSNHAWNEAFVDGRWVILDATWDSNNDNYGTGMIYGTRVDTYFDPSLENFSGDHLFWGEFSTSHEYETSQEVPTIITTSLPSGVVGSTYIASLLATGSPTITFNIASGSLPAGLNLLSNGNIMGEPTTTGTFNFSIQASNSVGNVTKEFSMTIAAEEILSITTKTLSDGHVGQPYSKQVATTGTVPITWSIASGALPHGLILSTTGVIEGIPTTAGTFTFTVQATNSTVSRTRSFSITIVSGNDIKKRIINFRSSLADLDTDMFPYYSEIEIDWGWELFNKSANIYDNDLAIAALALSNAAYTQTEVEKVLKDDLGFTLTKSNNYNKNWIELLDQGNIAHTMAYKSVIFNETQYNIFAIINRGTSDFADKMTDLFSIVDGFYYAAWNVQENMKSFMQQATGKNLSQLKNENNIFYITGHSYGGAVANNLALEFTDFAGDKQTFVYTFAAPKTVFSARNKNNVFNIINKEDIVPLVPPSRFTRIGRDLPYNRKDVPGLDVWFDILNNGKQLSSIMDKFLFPWEAWSTTTSKISVAHHTSTYMAYLLTENDWTLNHYRGTYKLVKVQCPVDVEIYNPNGGLAGQVIDNVTVFSNDVYIYIDGDEKYIYLPFDGEYSFKLTSTDTGTMTYTVSEYQTDGSVIREVVYEEVPLNKGIQYSSKINDEVGVAASSYNLVSSDGKTIQYSYIAEGNSFALSNFQKTRTYTTGTFTDVDGQWYTDWVRKAYEYGIISGVGNNLFNPVGNLSGAEAFTIGARIHAIYKYGAENADSKIQEFKRNDDKWYDMYLAYCKSEGLIGNELDNKLDSPITRAEMVFAWSKLLQQKDMNKQNTVSSLPDVTPFTLYNNEIIYFYEAGILSGTDSKGTFAPNNNITRAEAATIFMRLIESNTRGLGNDFNTR